MSEWIVKPAGDVPWSDIESLFGPRGACAGCWCMVWRRSRKDFTLGQGEGNRSQLKALWNSGQPLGLVGYRHNVPAAWISVAPKSRFVYFETSRSLRASAGDTGVWSISCLFVAKPWRRQGLAARMIAAARDWALAQGAAVVEGYPSTPKTTKAAPVFLWTGTTQSFDAAGFHPHGKPAGARQIYRSRA